jgi:hypothetical protein
VDKRYRAVVEGRLEGTIKLVHHLVRQGSLTRALAEPEPGAQEARPGMRFSQRNHPRPSWKSPSSPAENTRSVRN